MSLSARPVDCSPAILRISDIARVGLDIVINLHLQGHTVKEIAKITYHSPRAVDNYIGVFEAVLILYLYNIPNQLMARVLRKGVTLVEEHLRLVKIFMKSREEILYHLDNKGIKICSIIS